MLFVLASLYFILPAYIANMSPVLLDFADAPFAKPINKKLFGANKTWRGFYGAYLFALIVLAIQFFLNERVLSGKYILLELSELNIFIYAFVFGIGALTGDLVKSYFKRRIGIMAGEKWFPFDQIDFILGVYVFMLPFFVIPWQTALFLLLLTPLLHFLANVTAYKLGLKKVWW